MKINNDSTDVCGTSLVGYLPHPTPYEDIVKIFGNPLFEGDGYKTDAEWIIEFDDGEVATIYNWKNGKNYCGNDGLEIELITNWNIGGNSQDVVYRIVEMIQLKSTKGT